MAMVGNNRSLGLILARRMKLKHVLELQVVYQPDAVVHVACKLAVDREIFDQAVKEYLGQLPPSEEAV